MSDDPQAPTEGQVPPEGEAIRAQVLTVPAEGQVLVPMIPQSVPQSIKWWEGKTPDGAPVACVLVLSGRNSTYIEFDEAFADVFIGGMKEIFGKPTLEIARSIPKGAI
jgi:hypothetical protein